MPIEVGVSMLVDLLKRFTPILTTTTVVIDGLAVRVETNCATVIAQMLDGLGLEPVTDSPQPCFVWRIVVEPSEPAETDIDSWCPHAITRKELSLIHINRQNFLACDQRTREGISFISDDLAHDPSRFRRYFVPALLSLMESHEDVA
jgi:hypothetical protein